jgi:heterodisulfide reductase subunit D
LSKISDIVSDTRAYSCLDCGKCTAACPVSKYDPDFSPRKLVNDSIRGRQDLLSSNRIWSCITCGICEERCESNVNYTEFARSLRSEAFAGGFGGHCTHGGALQSLMHMMINGNLKQDRLGWLDAGLKVATGSEVLYFVGCSPYFDVIFADIGVETVATAKGAVKLLNASGTIPAVLANERCCGHDLLWAGDIEHFAALAKQNVAEIAGSGAKQVVTSCPECYHTLKVEYPKVLGTLDFEVLHTTQFLAEKAAFGALNFDRVEKRVTYQDPCRLGRFSGIYSEPRKLISAIPGLDLVEMPRSKKNALCCGTQAWINCGSVNRQIQNERLQEAMSTGAEVLLTSCPKCQIHLKCAQSDKRTAGLAGIEVLDLISLAARALAVQKATSPAVCEVSK